MLFQLIQIRSILDVILSSLLISGYFFIVIAGVINLKREEKLKSSIFFTIIGAVEILYEFLKWRLYNSIIVIFSEPNLLIVQLNYAILWIIPYIISILTFGVLTIILAKRNKENSGKRLLLSGIFWIIPTSILLVINIYGFFPVAQPVAVIFGNISIFVTLFMVVSRIFLLLYSVRIKEKNLLIASIFLMIASIVFTFYTAIDFIINTFIF
ncbi:MAG: hypothetical protein ACFE8E_14015 [Candidatus Hodarchaeota archaeon]